MSVIQFPDMGAAVATASRGKRHIADISSSSQMLLSALGEDVVQAASLGCAKLPAVPSHCSTAHALPLLRGMALHGGTTDVS